MSSQKFNITFNLHTKFPPFDLHSEFPVNIATHLQGGESLWVDSFAILNKLRTERPDYFEILCKTDVVFRAYSPGLNKAHVVGSYPTVELTQTGWETVMLLYYIVIIVI